MGEENPIRSKDSGISRFRPLPAELGPLSASIVGAALKVHKALGPGLLESVYERCLCHELTCRGVPFQSQVALPVLYEGIRIDSGLRIDMIVGGRIIVELKAAEIMHPVYTAQILTYLKLTGLRLGMLVNFNVPMIRDGIRRIIL